LRLWSLGFLTGVVVAYATGVALGRSKRFSYSGMLRSRSVSLSHRGAS
jgi:NitT/TauT family transport system permease protein